MSSSDRQPGHMLEAERDRLAAAVTQLPVGVVLLEAPSRRILLASAAAEQMLGRSLVGIAGDSGGVFQGWHSDGTPYAPDDWPFLRSALHGETVRNEIIELETGHGRRRCISVTSSPIRDRSGSVESVVCTLVDVTAERRAERALHESETRFRLVSAATNDVIWDWNLTSNTLVWSDAVRTVFRYAADETVDTIDWWYDHIHPADARRVMDGIHAVIDKGGSNWSDEYRFMRGDGHVATVFDRGFVVRNAKGEATRMIGSMVDLSERVELEEKLRQSQRMEAVGQLAGGIAHDFNNMLTAILTGCDLALDNLPDNHPVRSGISEIRGVGMRAAQLSQQLLAFSSRQVVQPQVLDVNDAVRGAQQMLRLATNASVRFELLLAPDLPPVRADRGQLAQILMNLVLNARDAMPAGGTLTVATSSVTVEGGLVTGLAAGEYVALTVCDTGKGMTEETRRRIFEPFFTTKEMGKGTGLGLAMVHDTVLQANGAVQVTSQLGEGTSLQILLPASREGVETHAPMVTERDSPLFGSETILLVEDEETVRRLVRRTLERYGYRVLEAHHGRAAIELHAREAGRIDMLLTDVKMPEMGGPEAAAEIRRHAPSLPVLFMSGYAEEAVRDDGVLLPESHFISKPFSPQRLVSTIREILDAPRVADRPSANSNVY